MGTEYYIADHRRKFVFGVGKNNFYRWRDNKEWMYDKDVLLRMIVETYARDLANFSVGYVLYFRDQLWEFIQNIQKEEDIEIISDHHLFTLEFEAINPVSYEKQFRYAKEEVVEKYIRENYKM